MYRFLTNVPLSQCLWSFHVQCDEAWIEEDWLYLGKPHQAESKRTISKLKVNQEVFYPEPGWRFIVWKTWTVFFGKSFTLSLCSGSVNNFAFKWMRTQMEAKLVVPFDTGVHNFMNAWNLLSRYNREGEF